MHVSVSPGRRTDERPQPGIRLVSRLRKTRFPVVLAIACGVFLLNALCVTTENTGLIAGPVELDARKVSMGLPFHWLIHVQFSSNPEFGPTLSSLQGENWMSGWHIRLPQLAASVALCLLGAFVAYWFVLSLRDSFSRAPRRIALTSLGSILLGSMLGVVGCWVDPEVEAHRWTALVMFFALAPVGAISLAWTFRGYAVACASTMLAWLWSAAVWTICERLVRGETRLGIKDVLLLFVVNVATVLLISFFRLEFRWRKTDRRKSCGAKQALET